MTSRISRAIGMLVLVWVALGWLPAPAMAQRAQNPTIITVLTQGSLQAYQDLHVEVRLTTDSGTPVQNGSINLFITSDLQRQVSTDANGVARFSVHFDLAPGTYSLVFSYKGDVLNMPSSRAASLLVIGTGNTKLTIEPLGNIPMGKNAIITVQLETAQGLPLAHERIQLFIDNAKAATGETNAEGLVQIDSGRDLSTGTHKLLAVYDGTRDHASASDTMELGVYALAIEIHTVPVLEGVRFSVNGHEFVSDHNGIAQLKVDSPGRYQVQVLPFTPKNGEVLAELASWGDGTTTSYNDMTVPMGSPMLIAFKIKYQVSHTFIDLSGNAVDPNRVTSMIFKRSDGAFFTFTDNQPRWLDANYFVHRLDGLVSNPYLYSLMNVTVNGTNVVSAQQQRYRVNPNDTWVVQLLLFSAHFKAHDTLFGSPLGTSIQLLYPDGYVLNQKLDANSETRVLSLPRGAYTISVQAHSGFSTSAPLTMSRNQEVDLPIVSYLDVLVGLIAALLIGPGLLLIGQPRLRRFLLHPFRPAPAPVSVVASGGGVKRWSRP